MLLGSSNPHVCRTPLRVRVKTCKTIIRPTVGLMADQNATLADILADALNFNDNFRKEEPDILEIVDRPMDIILSNEKTEGTDDAVRVQSGTSIREHPKARP